MKILATSDWQVGAGGKYGRAPYGQGSRLEDQQLVLGQIGRIADDHQVDLIIHAGDVLHTRTPNVAEILVAKRALERLALRAPVLVVAGNHDISSADRPASPEIFEAPGEITVALRPDIHDYDGVTVATLPWAPPGTFVARSGGRDGNVNAEISAALVDITHDLREDCPADRPAVLVLHWWVEGATTAHGVGEGVIHEPVIPLQPLVDQAWDAVICGHVHNPLVLHASGPWVGYCGPPAVTDFGEGSTPHGVWILDVDESGARAEFVAIADRAFVTLDADLTGGDTSGLAYVDIGRAANEQPVDGAVVRARYTVTRDQARRVDQAALRDGLLGAGAHQVFIEPRIVGENDRRRVEHVDEQLAPLAAVEAWCDAAEIPVEAARPLVDYTADLIAKDAA